MFYKLPGDGALNNLPPDQTVYLAYDMYFKEHSSYFHSKYYPKRGDIYTPDEDVTVATPQFNHISFRVNYIKNIFNFSIFFVRLGTLRKFIDFEIDSISATIIRTSYLSRP